MRTWSPVTDRPDAPRADEPHAPGETDVASQVGDDVAPDRPKGLVLLAGVVTLFLVAAVAFGVWALRATGDDRDAVAGEMDHTNHGSDAGHDGHDGHDGGAVLEGCDADAMHASMMMLDPLVADGLLESGCPWPYSADVVIEGGAEDPSIAAAFEPRRYAEIFDLLTVDRLGMCSVLRLPDPVVDGFVFGFRTQLHPGGCADGVATVQLDMREYATRAWRDAAARAAADGGAAANVVVLGRWVITTGGDDPAASDSLAESIVALDGAAALSA